MSRKTIFIGIVTLLILCFSTVIQADQYYDQYPGNGFLPADESLSYHKNNTLCNINHNDTSDGIYTCPVNFNVPNGSNYFIKSLGILYFDNITNGEITVQLRRENLYTGISHPVASWSSGESFESPSPQTYSQGTIAGYKLVDTKKFAYWLVVYFYVDGAVNPYGDLALYQVRIHYGT